jgi:uncharacterized protein YutE (UPF0331/DUF86 family)
MTREIDDVLLQKTSTIRRCVRRAREERVKAGDDFRSDFTHQDASLLNLFRAGESAIDLANHLVRLHQLGVPAWSTQVFEMLGRSGNISLDLSDRMSRMVGFRNLAIHEYGKLDMDLVESLFEGPMDDLLEFARVALERA